MGDQISILKNFCQQSFVKLSKKSDKNWRDSGLLKWHQWLSENWGDARWPHIRLPKRFEDQIKWLDLNGMAQLCKKATHLVLALIFGEKCSVSSDNDAKPILIFSIAPFLAGLPNWGGQFLEVEQEGGWGSVVAQLGGFIHQLFYCSLFCKWGIRGGRGLISAPGVARWAGILTGDGGAKMAPLTQLGFW